MLQETKSTHIARKRPKTHVRVPIDTASFSNRCLCQVDVLDVEMYGASDTHMYGVVSPSEEIAPGNFTNRCIGDTNASNAKTS